jgi:small subunit ribosomal protein S1
LTVEQQGGTQPQDEGTSSSTASDDRVATAVADEPAAIDEQTSQDTMTEGARPGVDDVDASDLATADPSPEAAIGASGANALGDAASLQGMVDSAIDGAREARAATDGSENGADADRATSAAATPADDTTTSDGAPTAAAADGEGATLDTSAYPTPPDAAADVTSTDAAAAPDTGSTDAPASIAEAATAADMPAAGDTSTGTDEGATGAAAQLDTPAPEELDAAPPAVEEEPPAPRDLGPEPTTMEELLNEQSGDIKSFKHGDVVEGAVVRIDKDEILVDIGAKSEGVVSNRELYGRNAESQPQLSIGDTVLVYVLQPESNEGHAVLSLRRAGLERKWRSMQEQFEAGVIIEAPVIDHNKGGLIVDCGIRGFVPISQIVDFPRRPQNDQPRDAAQEIAEKLQPFVGRKLRLKILEVNRKANRLILSEKVALYEERREKRDELFSSLQVGQKVTGTVRSIAPFGVFVDLGGIDGLVHKSELSWNKVNNPESGYQVGDQVEAEVIDINHERGRISLSIRRLQPDPWHSTVADFKVGDVIEGTVTKIVNFGAFVRVRDGLEGLIHISELSHQRVAHPADVVHEGQTLQLKIISLDSERHRLGLSLKQAEEPPARPATEAGGSAPTSQPRGERRPRQERSYDASQAVQEPEGGIDNTLAAAFAQVRQQMAATEDEEAGTTAPAATDDDTAAVPPAAEMETALGDAEPVAEADTSDLLADSPEATGTGTAETDDAPALSVAPAPDASRESDASTEDEASSSEGDVTSEGETTPEAAATEAGVADAGVDADTLVATGADDSANDAAAASIEPATTDDAAAASIERASTDDAAGIPDTGEGTDDAGLDSGAIADASTGTSVETETEAAGSDVAGLESGATDSDVGVTDDVPARGGDDDEGSPAV